MKPSEPEKQPDCPEKPDPAPPAQKPPAPEKTAKEPKKRDPIKIWTALVFLLLALLLVGHVLSDKYVPYTSDARVQAYVVPLAAEVAGRISKVYVTNNQFVKQGEKLVEIDTEKYKLAVEQAKADLQQAGQVSDADLASVATAQAKVTEAEANLENAKVRGERIIRLAKQGAASQLRADDARSNIASAKARLESARSELQRAKSKLGAVGKNNAQVKLAMANLKKAQLDLQRATVRAPIDGIITNLSVDVGFYANVGSPIMTFISTKDVWIQADLRENCLQNIDPGDPVEFVLDAAPSRAFPGKVRSIVWGVAGSSGSGQLGTLATVQASNQWLRKAQRFPVLVDFTNPEEVKKFLRAGGQANVIIYATDDRFLNSLGRFWIRMIGVFSNLY
jgi:multidrug resistance efflux pump